MVVQQLEEEENFSLHVQRIKSISNAKAKYREDGFSFNRNPKES
jgi:hypothetical protein